jgi:ectoine hydroxylase-related dioxygenase (phytanoyl-CoA dioxygenase family)
MNTYERDGYFLVRGLLTREEVSALLDRIEAYRSGDRPVPAGIRIQVEPKVERGEVEAGNPSAAIRKIEDLVQYDDLFQSLALKPQLVEVMRGLLGQNLKLYRNGVLMKPAGVGSAKGVHQDSPYWPIEPMNLASSWIAFDPATQANGCMMVVPGSHKLGALPHVAVQDDYVIPETHYDAGQLVPVEMEPGDALVFHSLLIHGSAPNRSSQPRRAITLSYMSTASRYVGRNRANPEPKPDYFRISGEDVPGGV